MAAFGIDLGATFARIAWSTGQTGTGEPQAAPPLRAAVYLGGVGQVRCGDEALQAGRGDPEALFASVRELLPGEHELVSEPMVVNGMPTTPERVVGFLLAELARRAQEAGAGPVREVIAALPASWGTRRAAAFREAVDAGGLVLLNSVVAPVAVCLHYRAIDDEVEQNIVVCDVGATRVETAALVVSSRTVEVVHTSVAARPRRPAGPSGPDDPAPLSSADGTDALAADQVRRAVWALRAAGYDSVESVLLAGGGADRAVAAAVAAAGDVRPRLHEPELAVVKGAARLQGFGYLVSRMRPGHDRPVSEPARVPVPEQRGRVSGSAAPAEEDPEPRTARLDRSDGAADARESARRAHQPVDAWPSGSGAAGRNPVAETEPDTPLPWSENLEGVPGWPFPADRAGQSDLGGTGPQDRAGSAPGPGPGSTAPPRAPQRGGAVPPNDSYGDPYSDPYGRPAQPAGAFNGNQSGGYDTFAFGSSAGWPGSSGPPPSGPAPAPDRTPPPDRPSEAPRMATQAHSAPRPVAHLRALRREEHVVLTWVWPEGSWTAQVQWLLGSGPGAVPGAAEVSKHSYDSQGGFTIRAGVGPAAFAVAAQVPGAEPDGGGPAQIRLAGLPPAVRYSVSVQVRASLPRWLARITLDADRDCQTPEILVVLAGGRYVPTSPADGTVVFRIAPRMIHRMQPAVIEVPLTALPKPAWIACFPVPGGPARVDVFPVSLHRLKVA